MNQEQATDSLGERQRENRIRTQNTDWRIDDENWEIHSLSKLLPLNLIATCPGPGPPRQKYKCYNQLYLSRVPSLDSGAISNLETIQCQMCSTLLCKSLKHPEIENVMLNTNLYLNAEVLMEIR